MGAGNCSFRATSSSRVPLLRKGGETALASSESGGDDAVTCGDMARSCYIHYARDVAVLSVGC